VKDLRSQQRHHRALQTDHAPHEGVDKHEQQKLPQVLTQADDSGRSHRPRILIPLLPYFFIPKAQTGLLWSAVVTACALVIFGAVKGKATGTSPAKSAVQTLLVGGIAAAIAFQVARAFSHTG
jgi:vacuolar iron transporter family protein